jgi:hypothetical protein
MDCPDKFGLCKSGRLQEQEHVGVYRCQASVDVGQLYVYEYEYRGA